MSWVRLVTWCGPLLSYQLQMFSGLGYGTVPQRYVICVNILSPPSRVDNVFRCLSYCRTYRTYSAAPGSHARESVGDLAWLGRYARRSPFQNAAYFVVWLTLGGGKSIVVVSRTCIHTSASPIRLRYAGLATIIIVEGIE